MVFLKAVHMQKLKEFERDFYTKIILPLENLLYALNVRTRIV